MATITSPRTASPTATPRITSPSVASLNSPVGTPTSSLRPSLEVTRPDGTTQPAPQKRNRAALRDYYNLKSRPETTPRSASIASNISDSTITSTDTATNLDANTSSPLLTKLDAASFSAPEFISSLLSTASLHDLLKTESALVSEIRNLDGERKALVYDNYSKLIKAVSTIGEMQKGMQKGTGAAVVTGLDAVGALEEKFGKLEVLVQEMAPDAGDDAAIEEERRQEDMRRQQDKVRWVLASPGRLQELDVDDAQKEWTAVQEVLDQWHGVKGVDSVREACEKVMKSKEVAAGRTAVAEDDEHVDTTAAD